MGLEATYLPETPGACLALQAAPVWPGLRVLHYSEGDPLRTSLPAGKRQSSGQESQPAGPLGSSGCFSFVHKRCLPHSFRPPHPCKACAGLREPWVGVPTAGCLNMGEMAQPSSRPPHQRQMAWQAEGLKGAGTFHRRVLGNWTQPELEKSKQRFQRLFHARDAAGTRRPTRSQAWCPQLRGGSLVWLSRPAPRPQLPTKDTSLPTQVACLGTSDFARKRCRKDLENEDYNPLDLSPRGWQGRREGRPIPNPRQ